MLLLALLSGCQNQGLTTAAVQPTSTPLTIRMYDWEDNIPQTVLDAFYSETGISVEVIPYVNQEEEISNIKADLVSFDVALVDFEDLPVLIRANKLHEIDSQHVPNLKNISANFRDLAYDPANHYSVPNSWGTTGLLVRTDLVERPITRWADLWDPTLAGKILIRNQPTEMIGITLKALGYSMNTAQPEQLDQARAELLRLKSAVTITDAVDAEEATQPLIIGEVHVMIGWSGDMIYAQESSDSIRYIIPEEGTMLWGDSYTISAASQHVQEAELFINFLLRPEINAIVINEYSYASANEAATRYADPTITGNPIVYPPVQVITQGEWYLPQADATRQRFLTIWDEFIHWKP